MPNTNLTKAKHAKNDEFYTQYNDIQKEVNAYLEYDPDVFRGKTILLPCDDPEWSNFTKFFAQNFENFGIKKLISTSYAVSRKKEKYDIRDYQFSLFETESPHFNEEISESHGKIFTLTRDKNNSGRIDIEDLEWQYLEGDGNFQSDEVKSLRHEADFIITNPPFTLYIDFIKWLFEEEGKKFLVIGNKSSISYTDIFPLIKENKMWSGVTSWSGGLWFITPGEDNRLTNVSSTWFTNIEHGRRHQPLQLMTMADNLKYSSHKKIKELGYPHYDNYAAIEVPFTDAIPSDYDGVMGVPVTFLEKFNPDQFEIVGITDRQDVYGFRTHIYTVDEYPNANDLNARSCIMVDGKPKVTYARILIKKK